MPEGIARIGNAAMALHAQRHAKRPRRRPQKTL
jgi:hypothetical protein